MARVCDNFPVKFSAVITNKVTYIFFTCLKATNPKEHIIICFTKTYLVIYSVGLYLVLKVTQFIRNDSAI